ncbi:S-layer homology domain-containing protein [Gracilibacillus xinjiangensis]|uniref:S-layer homology domain-containing protein n=1 Tax=Gracilibacillus xinjiangensis TaxID=1193282 RepID=A0ABV8WSP3_9BACI
MAISKKSKVFATSITAAVAATAVVPSVAAASLTDVTPNDYAADEIIALVEAGVITGYEDGSFKPGNQVTRAEASVMLSKILELDVDSAADAGFSDVDSDAWYAKYVNALANEGIIKGFTDGTFDPSGTLTRAEFAVMVVKAYDIEITNANHSFNDVPQGVWYTDYVETLFANELIKGVSVDRFAPDLNIKRADFARLLANADYEYGTLLNSLLDSGVYSVSADNPKILSVTGKNLDKLSAEDVTVEGNTVLGFNASANGETATVTLETPLVDGQEYNVTLKTDEGTQEFTVKYTFTLASVAITTPTIEANKDKQFLQVTLNGTVTDLSTIDSLGYEIEFQADKDVFVGEDAMGNPITTNTSATGEIDETVAETELNKSFNVKAVLTKDGKTAESETVTVKVVSSATPAIGNIVLETSNLELTKDIVSTKDTAVAVKEVVSNTGDVINTSGISSYASSNPEVATINASTGEIAPIKAGKTTITVTAGNVTYSKSITVVNEERVATKATANTATVAPGASFTTNVAITDQFGEKVEATDITAANIEVSEVTGETNVTADFAAAEDGKLPVTIAPATDAAAGSYTVVVKDLTTLKNLGQFTVRISSDNVADNYKLEVADSSNGIANLAGDNTVELNANEFTKSGGFLRTLDSGDGDIASFEVVSANPTIATVVAAPDANGIIEVTGVKVGSTQIVLKKDGIQVATATITVKEEAPVITSIQWKNSGGTISNIGEEITFEDVFTVTSTAAGVDPIIEGVNLSENTTSKVRIDTTATGTTAAPVLYLDTDDSGVFDADDVYLGELGVRLADPSNTDLALAGTLDWTNNILSGPTAIGDKGQLVFTVTDNDTNATVRASSTLNIDVN